MKIEPHPWGEFLEARKKCIHWLHDERKRSDWEIASDLSMSVMQVYQIRTYPYCEEKEIESHEQLTKKSDS